MHTRMRHDRVESVGIAGPLSLVILAVGLGGLALDVPGAWLAFPVGYGAVLPIAIHWHRQADRDGRLTRSERREGADDDALATLRERYARGDLGDEAFERRVERLLETEDGRTEEYR
jgi:uncharacterized membrane protein